MNKVSEGMRVGVGLGGLREGEEEVAVVVVAGIRRGTEW